MSTFDVVEASIAELRAALESGAATSEDLVTSYLRRIDRYDKNGPTLNSVVVPNPAALVEARDADLRCERGRVLGPLDGIPYTAKDSFLVPGLTAAAGSPAFVDLVAMRDAATIGRLREAGAICLGLTNMPPMANGGMQRGVYGRAESPYNPEYLTSAFASGSSNGSGTSPAASFAAFGLAEETWSSGRAVEPLPDVDAGGAGDAGGSTGPLVGSGWVFRECISGAMTQPERARVASAVRQEPRLTHARAS